MAPLPRELRRMLQNAIVAARDTSEQAARAALRALSVDRDVAHEGINDDDRALRVALRARARQLGDTELLVAEVAYEQWHRMLFARFLAENDLLMHPSGVAVNLIECADLAAGEGETDAWMLAARYASQMLPGIFRNEDPSVRVRFARDDVAALEKLLIGLPTEAFTSDDALGWVYQFWQAKKKDEVNNSERKIGGADLAPVTQLFTEHYMVAFLLENSLGAWWALRHPESPLLGGWDYLRLGEDGVPASGGFEGWPDTVSQVTMIDPCCGSGHFLVAGFDMLRKMREEAEGLSARDAADAVLRDNLFGLELDGRCVQIAVFALALAAWKVGGYRELPSMNIACSGVPARGESEDWRKLAQGDVRAADALERLRRLFNDADTLGSLIDPRRAAEGATLLGIDYERLAPLLHEALAMYGGNDPAQQVFEQAAEDVATAAGLLGGRYTLVATNPPYLSASQQTATLSEFAKSQYPNGKADLATVFLERAMGLCGAGGKLALVTPQNWLFLSGYRNLRRALLRDARLEIVVRLGSGAFSSIGGEVVSPALVVGSAGHPGTRQELLLGDCSSAKGLEAKAACLREGPLASIPVSAILDSTGSEISPLVGSSLPLLATYCSGNAGIQTGDIARFVRQFWEFDAPDERWRRYQGTVDAVTPHGGRDKLLLWEDGAGSLYSYISERLGRSGVGAWIRGVGCVGKQGVVVSQMGALPATLYTGDLFDLNCAVVLPADPEVLPAVWAFCSSDEYPALVRSLDASIKVTNSTLVKVPFDLERWAKVAADDYPNGLPQPSSDDPTQWLFGGDVADSQSPLQVAVARLLGYKWPDQIADDLEPFADSSGIVCIPSVAGESPGPDRLLELLTAAYGESWSPSVLDMLLATEGAQDLETWLREVFFTSHCRLFGNRPFIWHVWDGRKDGFSALVNYHRLDKTTLEKLAYSTLQWWIDRQRAGMESGVGGAEPRLAAALALQRKLAKLIEGEPPYDIYVRWKSLAEQPVGWDPDLDDGVRLNIRPFVKADVLRSPVRVNWNKDRGKNCDGSERLNELHFTVAEKLAARGEA